MKTGVSEWLVALYVISTALSLGVLYFRIEYQHDYLVLVENEEDTLDHAVSRFREESQSP